MDYRSGDHPARDRTGQTELRGALRGLAGRRYLRPRSQLTCHWTTGCLSRSQEWAIYLGVEKVALAGLLEAWFSERGIPVLPLGGYTSQSFISNDVVPHVLAQDRPSVLLYAGDFDPSGEDIDRDFIERTGCFDRIGRVALSAEQVTEYELPPQVGKAEDSRASSFEARHGRLVQVELDALPPDALRDLYEQAVGRFWDMSLFEEARRLEQRDREKL